MRETDTPRASRFEILGAWLHLWTPPRGVYIPPIPWPKVAIGVALLVVLGVLTAITVAPAIDDAKERSAAEERRADAIRSAARRERLRKEQRAVEGAMPSGDTRGQKLSVVQQLIGHDAQRRFRANGSPATCETAPGTDATAPRAVFDCFATVSEIRGAGKQEGAHGSLAIPYRAVLDFRRRRYAFCKTNPKSGELALPDPDDVVELPAVCRI